MSWKRRTLRALFFGATIFAWGLEFLRLAHHDFGEHEELHFVALVVLLALSNALWKSDRVLAYLGLITFVAVSAMFLLLPRLAYN